MIFAKLGEKQIRHLGL